MAFIAERALYNVALQGPVGPPGKDGASGAPGAPGADGAPGTTDWNALTNKPATFPPDGEAVDDRVAGLLTAGSNVTLAYNDAANTLTINSTASGGGTPGTAPPIMDSAATVGTSLLYSREDHIHPSDTTKYNASNPNGYQTAAQVASSLSPYALINSPILTGDPQAPTPATSDNDTSIATTAFVKAALSVAGGASLLVSDTPPVGAADGSLWFESDTGILYTRYNDGNSSQWVVATIGVTGPQGPPCTVVIAGGLF